MLRNFLACQHETAQKYVFTGTVKFVMIYVKKYSINMQISQFDNKS